MKQPVPILSYSSSVDALVPSPCYPFQHMQHTTRKANYNKLKLQHAMCLARVKRHVPNTSQQIAQLHSTKQVHGMCLVRKPAPIYNLKHVTSDLTGKNIRNAPYHKSQLLPHRPLPILVFPLWTRPAEIPSTKGPPPTFYGTKRLQHCVSLSPFSIQYKILLTVRQRSIYQRTSAVTIGIVRCAVPHRRSVPEGHRCNVSTSRRWRWRRHWRRKRTTILHSHIDGWWFKHYSTLTDTHTARTPVTHWAVPCSIATLP
jgi:hypothetical protein